MTFADVLVVGILLTLTAFGLWTLLAVARTRDPGILVILVLTAYWSVVGAIPLLLAKREAGGLVSSYIEDRLFIVYPDGDYSVTLMSYAIFMLGAVLTYWALTGRDVDRRKTLASWDHLARHFSHVTMLAIVGAGTAAKIAIVGYLVRSSGGESLYMATRIVRGETAGVLRIYQYLNIISGYSLACGLAVWLSFRVSREVYSARARILVWAAYLGLAAEGLGENTLLGNRAAPLLIMTALAVGWVSWRFLPASKSERRPLAARFGLLSLAGVITIGTIGISRGGSISSPGAVVASVISNLSSIGNVFTQMLASNEKLAAHMALYGVIRQPSLPRDPLAPNSYAVYTDLVQAPEDQVFTLHYIAGWWLRVGPWGVVLAALSFGLVLVGLHLLSRSAGGWVRSAFALPAAILPAAGVPVTVLRSGPESLRSVAIELVLIPGAVCLVSLWPMRYRLSTTNLPVLSPSAPASPSGRRGAPSMNTNASNDLRRVASAILRRWWVVVAAMVIGSLLALSMGQKGNAATAETRVPVPTLAAMNVLGRVVDVKLPLDSLVASLTSDETTRRLGDAVAGSAVVTTTATDNSSVTLRVTAGSATQAETAARAYAGELVRVHSDYVKAQAALGLKTLDAAISTIMAGLGPNGSASQDAATVSVLGRLADLQSDRAILEQAATRQPAEPTVKVVSSSNSVTSTIIMFALAFGAIAAALLGILALRNRTLRYPEDVDTVLGSGSLAATYDSTSMGWPVAALISRLGAQGTVNLMPAGPAYTDAEMERLRAAAGAGTTLRFLPPTSSPANGAPAVEGPVLLTARLGADSAGGLVAAARAVTAAGASLAGVLAVSPAKHGAAARVKV